MLILRKLALALATLTMTAPWTNANGMTLGQDLQRSMEIDLSAPSQNDPAFVEKAIRASATCRRHDDKSAIEQFHSLIKSYPDNPDASMLAASCFSRIYIYDHPHHPDLSHAQEIIRLLDKATKLRPNEHEWKAFYAVFLQEVGRFPEAVQLFQELFKNADYRLDKKLRYTVINYAIALEAIGKHDKAAEEIEKSVKATAYDEALSRDYVVTLSHAGHTRDMSEFVAEYNRNKGFSAKILDVECYQWTTHQQYSVARKCYESLVSNGATPRDLVEAGYINISRLLRRKKQYEQALRRLDEANKRLGETPRLGIERANTYFNMGEYESAARLYDRAINAEPRTLSDNETQYAQKWLREARRRLSLE